MTSVNKLTGQSLHITCIKKVAEENNWIYISHLAFLIDQAAMTAPSPKVPGSAVYRDGKTEPQPKNPQEAFNQLSQNQAQ